MRITLKVGELELNIYDDESAKEPDEAEQAESTNDDIPPYQKLGTGFGMPVE